MATFVDDGCDIDQHFQDNSLVFNIDYCGDCMYFSSDYFRSLHFRFPVNFSLPFLCKVTPKLPTFPPKASSS